MKPRTLFASLVLALLSAFLALPLQGCAAVAGLLPDVIAYVTDGSQILDAIVAFVNNYFVAHPDPVAQAKFTDAMTKARSALNVALRTAQGAKSLDDASVDAAFADFKAAYLDLMTLVKPYGVVQNDLPAAKFTVSKDTLVVPPPLAFRPAKAGAR